MSEITFMKADTRAQAFPGDRVRLTEGTWATSVVEPRVRSHAGYPLLPNVPSLPGVRPPSG